MVGDLIFPFENRKIQFNDIQRNLRDISSLVLLEKKKKNAFFFAVVLRKRTLARMHFSFNESLIKDFTK